MFLLRGDGPIQQIGLLSLTSSVRYQILDRVYPKAWMFALTMSCYDV